jgi:hypothetical protein
MLDAAQGRPQMPSHGCDRSSIVCQLGGSHAQQELLALFHWRNAQAAGLRARSCADRPTLRRGIGTRRVFGTTAH